MKHRLVVEAKMIMGFDLPQEVIELEFHLIEVVLMMGLQSPLEKEVVDLVVMEEDLHWMVMGLHFPMKV